MNRPTLRAVLLLACAGLCTGLLAACGEADDPPGAAAASALAQSVDATTQLHNAHLTASFRLAPDGLVALGGPIAIRASGPFATDAKAKLPRFDFAIAGSLGRTPVAARAISTGKQGFVRIGGRDYKLDGDILAGLLGLGRGGAARGGGLPWLGMDPGTWVKDPRANGHASIGGVDTTRISGAVDVRALLDDVAKLLGPSKEGFLGPKLRGRIEDAVTESKVDVWSGTQDRIVRRLAVFIDFAFKGGEAPIRGLDGGKVNLRVRLDRVNATSVDPGAPKRARPLSELLGHDDLGALLEGPASGDRPRHDPTR